MTDTASPGRRKRVFSGIQPTGHAHLGNYLGVFRRWAAMVDEYECFYCIVDLHAITREYEREDLLRRVFDLTVSLVASGIDPERCTLFAQSHVPFHSELQWMFNTVTPVGDLGRMTQFKEKSQGRESVNAGLLNYPVLQAADILLYRADFVPVGEDQRQHLELSREVARRWNARFGDFFPEPETLVGTGSRVRGLDGVAKMSKSKDNTVRMVAEPDELWGRLRTAVTDPARVRKDDPGNPRVCNVFALHEFFTDPAEREEIEILCQTAGIGLRRLQAAAHGQRGGGPRPGARARGGTAREPGAGDRDPGGGSGARGGRGRAYDGGRARADGRRPAHAGRRPPAPVRRRRRGRGRGRHSGRRPSGRRGLSRERRESPCAAS